MGIRSPHLGGVRVRSGAPTRVRTERSGEGRPVRSRDTITNECDKKIVKE